MKKITLLFTLFICIASYAQEEVKTTYEEYKFLSESYAYQDNVKMLEGYELKPLLEETKDIYNFNFKRFVHTESGKTQAIFVTITKIKKKEDKIVYLCMPINNPELFAQYNNRVYGLGATMYDYYNILNRELVMSLFHQTYNGE